MMWTTQLRSKSSKNITYYRRGSGLPIILIHGVGLKLECWNAQIQYLKKYFDVIAIDLPGHGESEILESRDVNIDLYSEVIKSFTDEIIQKKFIIMGHSLGALIALDYIKKYKDDCYGLIALNCIYQRDNEAMNALKNRLTNSFSENFDKEVDTTIKRWFGEGESTENIELAKYCRSWLLNSNKTGYRSAYKVFANYKGVPKKLLMENIEAHIAKDKEILDNPMTSPNQRRHIEGELHELEVYAENHKEEIQAGDHHDPTPLELFCEVEPSALECKVFDD